MKNNDTEMEFHQSPQPKIADHINRSFTLAEGDNWIDFEPNDVLKIFNDFGSNVSQIGVEDFQMNIEVILR